MGETNLTLARTVQLKDISEIAGSTGLQPDQFEALGKYKAKLTDAAITDLQSRPQGRLILVTAITPTPSGEGKTTVTVGLAQALNRNGHRAMPAVREPALGPIFGVKGGATGGGRSQVLPMEDINLFFTGDFPAITAAHNLLSAMLDAHIHHGNELRIDTRRVTWPRTLDVNDRALREIVVALGGTENGIVREDRFVITPASEVMAILCLAKSRQDLKERLGHIMVGMSVDKNPVWARDIQAQGAMAMLLRDAWRPNIVQTSEGGLAFVHGGPFANIAQGTSTVVAAQCALGLADTVVTEAGFASDLGAEKFMHVVSPHIGKRPDLVVLVATVRAVRHHGDGDLEVGAENLTRHIRHLQQYGLPVVVAVNRFKDDDPAELEFLACHAEKLGAAAAVCDPWNNGGDGCIELAETVNAVSNAGNFTPIVDADGDVESKIEKIVKSVYGGASVTWSKKAATRLSWAKTHGYGNLPVCMAKTQSSLSADPKLKNAPTGFDVHVEELRPSLGAGFMVAVCGEIMLMPGLAKVPAAVHMDVDAQGEPIGLV